MSKSLISSNKTSLERQFSAGGVVFKKVKDEGTKIKVLWLITKSRPSKLFPKTIWRLPKGWLDDELGGKRPGPLASGKKQAKEADIQKAALREVEEEGGARAKIIGKIGTEKYFLTISGQRILKFVTFYLMEWIKDLPSGPGEETEKVEWLPYGIARQKLSYSGEKKMLDEARRLLKAKAGISLV